MTDNDIVKIENRNGYVWIVLPGTINRDNILQIQGQIDVSLTAKNQKVVLDLSKIETAGSIIINLIMDTRKRVTNLKGTLQLVNLTEKCMSLFKSINLDTVLKICAHEDEID